MNRRAPNVKTLRLLYTLSGNECAFPNCDHPIFDQDGLYVAELCHIEAESQGGPRYNPSQDGNKRNGFDNLVFMCHRHHREIDNKPIYSVETLKEIKNNHEARFSESGKIANKMMLQQIDFKITNYWNEIKDTKYEFEDFKVKRDVNTSIESLFNEINEHMSLLSDYCEAIAESDSYMVINEDLKLLFEKIGVSYDLVEKLPYYDNPFANRNWVYHNIGRLNYFMHVNLTLSEIKVKIYESLFKLDPNNEYLNMQLDKAQAEFKETYDGSRYVD
jgi:hypothetical protein